MLSSDADAQGFALDAAVIAARGSRRQPAACLKITQKLKKTRSPPEGTLKARFSTEGEMWRRDAAESQNQGRTAPKRARITDSILLRSR